MLLGYVSPPVQAEHLRVRHHGKTTTTSMIALRWNWQAANPLPSSAASCPSSTATARPARRDIVIEACEFAGPSLKLTPYLSVVLNIDNDHLITTAWAS